jgi:hypothetical protein
METMNGINLHRARRAIFKALILLPLVVATGCGEVEGDGNSAGEGAQNGNGNSAAGSDAGFVGQPDAGPPPQPDAGPAPAVDAGAPPDAGPPPAEDAGVDPPNNAIRFVALGDSGKGNEGQALVAAAIKSECDARGGCDFALLLGDNIYDTGVDDIDDAQWQEKFEIPYQDLDFPFYATLGNHDYGAPPELDFLGGIGIDPRRGENQVDYGGTQSKFTMPNVHYKFEQGPVEFVSLNTTSMFWADLSTIEESVGFDEDNTNQRADLLAWEMASTAPWRIAFGHHPYVSNGPHGNAGQYDGVIIDGLIGSGTELKEFFDEYVKGHFDVYLCGHDHSLQDLGTIDGTDFLVSGGGASHTDFEGDNNVEWQADRRGFLMVEADNNNMTFTFFVVPDSEDGVTDPYTAAPSRTITRP